jgi:hypothetical protein
MPWDRELQVLEESIRNLNAQYDSFLYGSSARPPIENRRRVNAMIRRLSGTQADTAADRFRFTTLQGRYNTLCERWDRLQGEKEAGRRPGVYGHFTLSGPIAAAGAPFSSNARPAASVEPKEAPGPHAAERDLFVKFIEAKKAKGEDVGGYEFERFLEDLAREREKIQEHFQGAEVEFDVTERDGRVRLVARRKEVGKGR